MILFLDFDGVLHPFERPTGVFVLLPAFERVMRDFGHVDIVISSAWRETHALDKLKTLFSDDIRHRIVGVTPVLYGLDTIHVREAEIKAWLEEAGRADEAWVAIDDIDCFFSPGCPNLILVDSDVGFNAEAERELRRRLGRSIPLG